jgi:hypothetical protein
MKQKSEIAPVVVAVVAGLLLIRAILRQLDLFRKPESKKVVVLLPVQNLDAGALFTRFFPFVENQLPIDMLPREALRK